MTHPPLDSPRAGLCAARRSVRRRHCALPGRRVHPDSQNSPRPSFLECLLSSAEGIHAA